jgi:hypothetical protein
LNKDDDDDNEDSGAYDINRLKGNKSQGSGKKPPGKNISIYKYKQDQME